jgi:hypothetical protein
VARVTIAFASGAHARSALRFLAAGVELRASPVTGGDGASMAQVEVDVRRADVARFRTLLAGVHGLVVAESAEIDTRIA